MALREHRCLSGRGTLFDARRLWKVAARGYAEWRGMALAGGEGLAEPVKPLRSSELAELIQLAQEQPGMARDLLKMAVEARRQGKRVVTKHQPWSSERKSMLIELHTLGLAAARRELERARQAYDRSKGEDSEDIGYRGRLLQRERMVKNCERQVSTLQFALSELILGDISEVQ